MTIFIWRILSSNNHLFMLESQQYCFFSNDPDRPTRVSQVEKWNLPDNKTVCFISQSTGMRTHVVLLPTDACCEKCTELENNEWMVSCSPFRKQEGNGFLESYATVFLMDMDLKQAVCPLFLSWNNPTKLNLIYNFLGQGLGDPQDAKAMLDIIQSYPNWIKR